MLHLQRRLSFIVVVGMSRTQNQAASKYMGKHEALVAMPYAKAVVL